jgi:hypothetical protein
MMIVQIQLVYPLLMAVQIMTEMELKTVRIHVLMLQDYLNLMDVLIQTETEYQILKMLVLTKQAL